MFDFVVTVGKPLISDIIRFFVFIVRNPPGAFYVPKIMTFLIAEPEKRTKNGFRTAIFINYFPS